MGIGRAIATSLAKEGVRLAVMARRRNLLEELEKEIGAKLVIIECDFLKPDSVERISAAALAGLGSVDILVNNAGGSRRFTLEASEEQWEEALTLNFTRQRQLTHKLLAQMMARNWGRIVNITGKSEPEGINGAFCAKAAMHSWAKGLSREVGKHGITVNSVPPGRIISEQILRNYPPEFRKKESEEEKGFDPDNIEISKEASEDVNLDELASSSGEARKHTRWARSSGCPYSPTGMSCSLSRCLTSGE